MHRRDWLRLAAAASACGPASMPGAWALPPRTPVFPRDFGSHPDLRTEWWYITGQVLAGGRPWGFQLTFFRSRVAATRNMRSDFAARQLILAHAALCDVQGRRLLHDQRMARAGMGLADAATTDTRVHIQDWQLQRQPVAGQPADQASRYLARLKAGDFTLDLQFDSTQPVLLQGRDGLSRKGPDSDQASYYYSQPQLLVSGSITVRGRRLAVESPAQQPHANRAWLDHECSEALLHQDARGWDWIGMNLDDGSALTAFHLRRPDGSALWAGGSFRSPGKTAQSFAPQEVRFEPLRYWSSPLSRARYPIAWRVQTPAGRFEVQALVDDQELDSRASTGAIYWEGLSELLRVDADGSRTHAGSGYLEMTGYADTLRLGD
jgi:predicted secreted hydrolase